MWLYEGRPFTSEDIGEFIAFVYIITRLDNGRQYVGKKLLYSTRKNPKTRRRKKVESDWQKYWGSNAELIADVEKLGAANFKREILHLCRTKGEASYYEIKEQVMRDVLLSESYYNTFVGCRINKKHLPKCNGSSEPVGSLS